MRFCGNYIYESDMPSFMEAYQHDSHCFFGYKNAHLVIEQVTQSTAMLFNIKNPEHLHGINDYEVPAPSVMLAPSYIEQDKKVLTGKKLLILDAMPCYTGEYFLGCTTRVPVVDDRLHIIGSALFARHTSADAVLTALLPKLISRDKKSGISLILQEESVLMDDTSCPGLSKKELNILWLLARGMSPKKIAAFLSRSSRTIEDHIDHLKIKYQCADKSTLIEKSIHMGILNYLPRDLIHRNTIEIL